MIIEWGTRGEVKGLEVKDNLRLNEVTMWKYWKYHILLLEMIHRPWLNWVKIIVIRTVIWGIHNNQVKVYLEVNRGQMGLTMYYRYQTGLYQPVMQA